MINVILTEQIDVINRTVKTKNITNDKLFIAYDYLSKKWIAIIKDINDFEIKDFTKIDNAVKWLRNK